MNPIEITRVEFRWLLSGLITIPFIVFSTGFYMGASAQDISQNPHISSQAKSTPEPAHTNYSIPHNQFQSFDSIKIADHMTDSVYTKSEPLTQIPVEVVTPEKQAIALDEINLNLIPQHLYTVQVGNFSDLNNAGSYKVKLQSKGVNARILGNTITKGKPTYRVIIGLFTNESAAQKAAAQHEYQQNQDAYVATL